jgi:ribA/ribD-fused uncharacterized protein
MKTAELYWGMLLKGQSEASGSVQNIHQNVQGGKLVGFNKKNGTEFLSNFHPSTVAFEGKLYPAVEHAYQASKTLNQETRELIKKANSPGDAKKLGRSLVLRADWIDVRLGIMRKLIHEKFENPFLRHQLLGTGDLELINENRWNDRFFGVTGGVGENWLGKILEEVRKQAREDDSNET